MLQYGTAVRDITPHFPVWSIGYGNRSKCSSGVLEPVSLGCLAVSDGDARILMFMLDIIGVRYDVCEELYALLAKETGVGYPNIMISGSHTHFGPGIHETISRDPACALVASDPKYLSLFKNWMVEAAKEALGNLRPMRLETMRINSPQVVFNRRTVRKSDGMVEMNLIYPDDPTPYDFSPVDDELTVHRLVTDDGVQGVLMNFGCHPVTGCSPDKDYYRFSADYPYYARKVIEEAWHCPVFFTLGAAGDAVPINRKGDCRERIGTILGHTTVLAERRFQTDADDTLAVGVIEVEAETIIKTLPETAEVEYKAAREAVLAVEDTKSDEYRRFLATFHEKAMLCSRARQYPDNKGTHNVQFIRIGETVFVSLGFEVLAEIGLKMKEQFPNSVMVSCCGGYQGYLPLAYEYDRVGYEATESSTHFVPGTADLILGIILERLKKSV